MCCSAAQAPQSAVVMMLRGATFLRWPSVASVSGNPSNRPVRVSPLFNLHLGAPREASHGKGHAHNAAVEELVGFAISMDAFHGCIHRYCSAVWSRCLGDESDALSLARPMSSSMARALVMISPKL